MGRMLLHPHRCCRVQSQYCCCHLSRGLALRCVTAISFQHNGCETTSDAVPVDVVSNDVLSRDRVSFSIFADKDGLLHSLAYRPPTSLCQV